MSSSQGLQTLCDQRVTRCLWDAALLPTIRLASGTDSQDRERFYYSGNHIPQGSCLRLHRRIGAVFFLDHHRIVKIEYAREYR